MIPHRSSYIIEAFLHRRACQSDSLRLQIDLQDLRSGDRLLRAECPIRKARYHSLSRESRDSISIERVLSIRKECESILPEEGHTECESDDS
jgi:hypothetical protein